MRLLLRNVSKWVNPTYMSPYILSYVAAVSHLLTVPYNVSIICIHTLTTGQFRFRSLHFDITNVSSSSPLDAV